MNMKDFIQPFMIQDHSANGRYVVLEDSITKILNLHAYPNFVANILSELGIISCFLGQNLKKDGIITTQIRSSDGIIKIAVAEFSFGGSIRAYSSYNEDTDSNYNYSFQEIIGNGQLLVNIESGDERYQGIIELKNEGISKSFENYLQMSEQIKSEVKIFTDTQNIYDEIKFKACGIILKKLPEHSSLTEDNWDKFSAYINSLTKEEVINNSCDEILKRLFHSDGVIIYDPLRVKFSCRCSREKMEKALNSIPENELENYKIDGKIQIKCQFCNKEEKF
jgi:molecular chaperone Hsp33